MQARRNRIGTANRAQASHAGLLLSRYLSHAVPAKNASEAEKRAHQDDKRQLHRDAMAATVSGQKCYALAYDRWTGSLPRETSAVLPVQGRLIVGLGGDNVLETGLTLHHTYGVPIIPGSAIKGLAAHYCDQVWGNADTKFKKVRGKQDATTGEYHEVLFGTTDDSGHITFYDAWITPDSLRADGTSGLVLDVMTPHHSDYYSGNTRRQPDGHEELIPPTDFDDPNPVTFLSVAGAFHVAVSCDVPGEAGDRWAKLAFDLLKEALREWGVGGKTSSGYGRLGTESAIAVNAPQATAPIAVVSKSQPRLPEPNKELVEAELIERREKAGGKLSWRAKHLGTGISGPIQNSETIPADAVVGTRLQLFVAYAKPTEIAFKYPSEEVKKMVERMNAKTPPPKGGSRGPHRGR